MATAPNDSEFWKKWFDDILLQLRQTNETMGGIFTMVHAIDKRVVALEANAKPSNKLTIVIAAAIPSAVFALLVIAKHLLDKQ